MTTVAVVGPEQSAALLDALIADGFACDETAVRRCERTRTPEDSENYPVETGEVHLLGSNGWVATQWINIDREPEYSDAIRDRLWG